MICKVSLDDLLDFQGINEGVFRKPRLFEYTILLLIVWFSGININAQAFDKGVLVDSFLYFSSQDNHSNVMIFKNIEKTGKMDSFPVSALLSNTSGIFYRNPLAWDIIDNALFVVSPFEDHLGMNYTQLRLYDLTELKRLHRLNRDSLNNYLCSSGTIKSKPIGPLEKYVSAITFNTDTSIKKIYFDILCDDEALYLYIYLEGRSALEIWKFTRYPLLRGYISASDKDGMPAIYKKNPWELVYTHSLEISCPFRVFEVDGKTHLIGSDGQAFQFIPASGHQKQSKSIRSLTRSLLLLNKNENELVEIPKSQLTKAGHPLVKDKIRIKAKRLRLDPEP